MPYVGSMRGNSLSQDDAQSGPGWVLNDKSLGSSAGVPFNYESSSGSGNGFNFFFQIYNLLK
jgi:hypothetical protein